MTRAIRKHARDFAFIIGLVLVALLVGGYILSNQRFYLPKWVPVAGLGLRRLQGPVLHRAVGDAGPGPDGPGGGRRRRRHHQGGPRRRARGRDDEDPAQVHADLQERHGAAAPQDRPERHGHRARPGHAHGGRGADGLHRPGRPDAAQRQLRRDPVLAGHGHAQLPAAASRRRGRGGRRPGQGAVGHAEALRADRALHGQAQRRAGRARAQHPPLDPQLPPALAGAGRQGRRPGGAGGLVQPRVQGVRRPGREPARVAAGAPGCPAGHEHHAWPR